MATVKACGCGVRYAPTAATRPVSRASVTPRLVASPALLTSASQHKLRRATTLVRAEGRSESSFVAGFVLGGVVFGALGFIFAPQISKTILGDDSRLKLPRFLEDESPKDPEATKQDLIDKIAQLNASIDEVAATLKTKETTASVNATEEVLNAA